MIQMNNAGHTQTISEITVMSLNCVSCSSDISKIKNNPKEKSRLQWAKAHRQ